MLLAGVRRRFAPHQLRHAHAVEMRRNARVVPLRSGGDTTATVTILAAGAVPTG
jgi:hypothetical protein